MKTDTTADYLDKLPEDRKEIINQLRIIVLENLPQGFEEVLSSGMLQYVVPHQRYPDGYHCNPKLPLPFFKYC